MDNVRYGSGWVVTQAALNGVARYAGHALQIMALVRPAAPSAFEGLRQLVDLYAYCVFTSFCPQWSIDGEFLFVVKKIRDKRGKTKAGTGKNKKNGKCSIPFDDDFGAMEAATFHSLQLAVGAGKICDWFLSQELPPVAFPPHQAALQYTRPVEVDHRMGCGSEIFVLLFLVVLR